MFIRADWPRAALAFACGLVPALSANAEIAAVPGQTSTIRLSNRDVNHVICVDGEIEDVRFSAEKGLLVERAGPDAWIKFLVREVEDMGAVTRSYVTTPSEFFISCNGAIYPLYAEPADIPAQTITLVPGPAQRARVNAELMGPLALEERAVSITLSLLQDRVPASFAEVATRRGAITIEALPSITLSEQRRLDIEGSELSASEYRVETSANVAFDERAFLDLALGANIFAVTADRLSLKAGEAARLVIVRRGKPQ